MLKAFTSHTLVTGLSSVDPGPSSHDSEHRNMQQRVFSELVDDHFDLDSCCIMDGDPSPIIIHGSDSETDDDVVRMAERRSATTHCNSFPGQSSFHDGDWKEPSGNTHPESNRPLQTTSNADEIRLFIDDDEDDYFKPRSKSHGVETAGPSTAGDRGTVGDKGKGRMGSHKSKHKKLWRSSHEASGHHSLRKHRKRDLESGDSGIDEEDRVKTGHKRKHSKHKEDRHSKKQKERSYSVDRSKSSEGHRNKGKRRSNSSDEEDKHAKKQKRNSSRDQSREPDDQHKMRHKGKRKARESNYDSDHDRHGKGKHGSRESQMDSVDRSKKHHRRPSSHSSSDPEWQPIKRSRESSGQSPRGFYHANESTSMADKGLAHGDRSTSSTDIDDGIKEQLIQEAKAIDDEIKASKREILKSALKKERIALLQKNMEVDGASSVKMAPTVTKDTGQQALQDELTELNKKIVNEKRRLLKVVKHIEEEKADHD